MLRLHIDKNTLSGIRKVETEEYKRLFNILDNNRHIFFMTYSAAHIQDMQNDKTDIKFDEAKFFDKFIGNYYLSYNAVDKKLGFYLKSAEEILRNHKSSDIYFTNLFDAFDDSDSELKPLIDALKQLFKLPTMDLQVDPEGLKAYDNTLAKFLPYNQGPQSINDFIQHFQNLHIELSDKSSTLYKETRKTNIDLLHFNRNQSAKNLADIDKLLIESGIGKTLHELIMHSGRAEPSRSEYFTRGFVTLNMLALDKEKNKKAEFENMVNDADHAFYASHADILISEDVGFRYKAGLLYEINGVRTLIMSPQEFMEYFDKLEILPMDSTQDFIEVLRNLLPRQPYDAYKSQDFNRVTNCYQLNSALFNYFDHLEYVNDSDSGKFYVLTARKSYYSITLFYKEIELITNNLIRVFGPDVAKREKYMDIDDQQLREHKWEGRLWSFGGIPATLEINKGSGKLSMVIGPFSDVAKENIVAELSEE